MNFNSPPPGIHISLPRDALYGQTKGLEAKLKATTYSSASQAEKRFWNFQILDIGVDLPIMYEYLRNYDHTEMPNRVDLAAKEPKEAAEE